MEDLLRSATLVIGYCAAQRRAWHRQAAPAAGPFTNYTDTPLLLHAGDRCSGMPTHAMQRGFDAKWAYLQADGKCMGSKVWARAPVDCRM